MSSYKGGEFLIMTDEDKTSVLKRLEKVAERAAAMADRVRLNEFRKALEEGGEMCLDVIFVTGTIMRHGQEGDA